MAATPGTAGSDRGGAPARVTPAEPGVPSDNTTLVDVLSILRREGYTSSLSAGDDGDVTCSECGTTSPADRIAVDRIRRLEGASDPSDELIVAAGVCPECDRRGVAILGFGPSASAADAAVVALLDLGPG